MQGARTGGAMIRLAVVSGKGGTGKTMLTAALSRLFPDPWSSRTATWMQPNSTAALAPDPHNRPVHGLHNGSNRPRPLYRVRKIAGYCRFGAIEQDVDTFRSICCTARVLCLRFCLSG